MFERFKSPFNLGSLRRQGNLLSFLFHAVYESVDDVYSGLTCPHQPLTIKDLRQFIEYFLEKDCRFSSPDDILAGLEENKNHALITFDDGYFNNVNALPVLKEYRVPAVFFPTIKNVRENMAFWWDIICRERTRGGASISAIKEELGSMVAKTGEEIDGYIRKTFGERSLFPIGELDRPLSAFELKELSKESCVFIGNHAMDHAHLTNYTPEGIKQQIGGAQRELFNMTGKSPIMISYPHGQLSNEIMEISKDCGLRLGVTTKKRAARLPIDRPFEIGRFALDGRKNIRKQSELSLRAKRT